MKGKDKTADLHTHSHYSDGLLSPAELVRLACKRGIKHLALTDHNSVKGVKEAEAEGKKLGIHIIPAVEMQVKDGEVLGYFIHIKNKKLLSNIKEIGKKIEKRTREWCRKLEKAGYPVSFKEIWRNFPNARGNINSFYPIYLLYLKTGFPTLQLAQELRKKKELKAPKMKDISAIKGIKLIKDAGGVPVLAHPWIDKDMLKERNIKRYIKAGLKGIEINNGDRYPYKKKGMDKKIKRMAKKYSLVLTSGSDFHGGKLVKQMPGDHNLGKNNCSEKIVRQLEDRKPYKEQAYN